MLLANPPSQGTGTNARPIGFPLNKSAEREKQFYPMPDLAAGFFCNFTWTHIWNASVIRQAYISSSTEKPCPSIIRRTNASASWKKGRVPCLAPVER